MKTHNSIEELIRSHRPGWTLAQPFYNSQEVFDRDMERVFMRHWLYVGHVSRVRNPGDYFLFNIGKESIIVIRAKDGKVHALFNVCRHRGSRVCLESSGTAQALVCPYHAWTYAPDGRLLAARSMPEDFNTAEFGLHKCHVRVLEGLIYIHMGKEPSDFEPICRDVETFLKPHELDQAKIAKSLVWRVKANWKLVVENFGECYHCGPAHPEYCSVMAHAVPDGSGAQKHKDEFTAMTAEWEARVKPMGSVTGRIDPVDGGLHSCTRIPIGKGALTQSRDGKPVAPLMGRFKEYDGGYTAGRIYPINYFIALNDHAVIPRFTPIGPLETEVEMLWLVRGDAVEGKDYDVDKLTWIWVVTTDQDKKIVDDNQAGVNSMAYRPGMYSNAEQGLTKFTMWYLEQLR